MGTNPTQELIAHMGGSRTPNQRLNVALGGQVTTTWANHWDFIYGIVEIHIIHNHLKIVKILYVVKKYVKGKGNLILISILPEYLNNFRRIQVTQLQLWDAGTCSGK